MAKSIEALLHRRTDLSTFLIHLTRSRGDGPSGRDNLKSILVNSVIEARSTYGPAGEHEELLASSKTQRVVCFTETPLEHTWMMLEETTEARSIKFEPYGVVITKTTGRKSGANPVWYSDMSRWGEPWPAAAVNRLVQMAVLAAEREAAEGHRSYQDALSDQPIFELTPFFEQMGPMASGGRKEFWWEREWRKPGDLHLSRPARVVSILAPENEHDELRTFMAAEAPFWIKRPLLDPRWGLERMLVGLAGLPQEDIGPFPALGYGY